MIVLAIPIIFVFLPHISPFSFPLSLFLVLKFAMLFVLSSRFSAPTIVIPIRRLFSLFPGSLVLAFALWFFLLVVVFGGSVVVVFLALDHGWPPVLVFVGSVLCSPMIVSIPLRLAILEIAALFVMLRVALVALKSCLWC